MKAPTLEPNVSVLDNVNSADPMCIPKLLSAWNSVTESVSVPSGVISLTGTPFSKCRVMSVGSLAL